MNNFEYFKSKYIKYKTKYIKSKTDKNTLETEKICAVAFFNENQIKGTVIFEEIKINSKDLVKLCVNLSGFEPNSLHGFHVHEYGDLTKGCATMCDHFNPFNKTHGAPNDIERHVGDLGNLCADYNGVVNIEFTDQMIKLRGSETNIIGRGLIIHADPDDCGKGLNEASKINGNAGKRIGCAIIGYKSPS